MTAPNNKDDDLAPLRAQIDAIDHEILALLNRRAHVAEQVGEVKKREGTPFFRPDRVASLIAKLQKANTGPLKDRHVAAVWREIVSVGLDLESPVRVAYLGPAGTYSEQATQQVFGTSFEQVPCISFDEVFRSTAAGTADFGVVPVENSTEGVVARTLDLLLDSPLHIIGETSLLIRHNLMRLTDSLEGIEVVHAHPQALAQCHGWLSAHLPHVERRPASSNAEGARLASTNPAWAAIAGERASTEFGLHNVARAIQDDAHNRTRFFVVCLPKTLDLPQPTGQDCVSLIVSVPNRPGALHDLLVPFKKHGVSMTRFESRPLRSGAWEYYFYIDLLGHANDANVAAALQELRGLCAFYKLLGTYPAAQQ